MTPTDKKPYREDDVTENDKCTVCGASVLSRPQNHCDDINHRIVFKSVLRSEARKLQLSKEES